MMRVSYIKLLSIWKLYYQAFKQ